MTTNHTPTPWEIKPNPYASAPEIISANRRIAKVLYEGGSEDREVIANAEFICRAVNNFDNLLSALEKLLEDVEFAQPQIEPGLIGNLQIRKAREALAKAK